MRAMILLFTFLVAGYSSAQDFNYSLSITHPESAKYDDVFKDYIWTTIEINASEEPNRIDAIFKEELSRIQAYTEYKSLRDSCYMKETLKQYGDMILKEAKKEKDTKLLHNALDIIRIQDFYSGEIRLRLLEKAYGKSGKNLHLPSGKMNDGYILSINGHSTKEVKINSKNSLKQVFDKHVRKIYEERLKKLKYTINKLKLEKTINTARDGFSDKSFMDDSQRENMNKFSPLQLKKSLLNKVQEA